MSYFYTPRQIKATRKPHRCEGCGTAIEVGSPAYYYAGLFEGDFYAGHYHTDCRAAEVAWNDVRGTWGDEFDSLCAIRDEPDDVVWLIGSHPAVAARMGLIAAVLP